MAINNTAVLYYVINIHFKGCRVNFVFMAAIRNISWGLVAVLCLLAGSAVGNVVPDEDWGYVTVRQGAHMFWWLYGSTAPDRDDRPLVMWLQVG